MDFVLVLVVVLVLESGRGEYWSVGVMEYCGRSEMHRLMVTGY
jgi:hypothetical protein